MSECSFMVLTYAEIGSGRVISASALSSESGRRQIIACAEKDALGYNLGYINLKET